MFKSKELETIQNLCENKDPLISTNVLESVHYKNKDYPIVSFSIGTTDKSAPVLGLFGGVHGLEKIGTHVVLSYLSSLFYQLKWDRDLRDLFQKFRIVSIPLINPAGMAHFKRSNPRGVDLMRNAPIIKDVENTIPLISGHTISNKLPWYRGVEGEMEKESHALVDFVQKEIFPSKVALSVDFHSGFGLVDRLWYPYGYTNNPSIMQPQIDSLINLFNNTIPHHVYQIEPQSASYGIYGDLWDYLFDEYMKHNPNGVYIPWTLEMGSWNWVRKNPLQLFNIEGLFNPMKDHRYNRTMRRHFLLIDFLAKASRNVTNWNE